MQQEYCKLKKPAILLDPASLPFAALSILIGAKSTLLQSLFLSSSQVTIAYKVF